MGTTTCPIGRTGSKRICASEGQIFFASSWRYSTCRTLSLAEGAGYGQAHLK